MYADHSLDPITFVARQVGQMQFAVSFHDRFYPDTIHHSCPRTGHLVRSFARWVSIVPSAWHVDKTGSTRCVKVHAHQNQ